MSNVANNASLFHQKLKASLTLRGMTIAALAEKLSKGGEAISADGFYQLARRQSFPSADRCLLIAQLLDVPLDWLVNEDDASLEPPNRSDAVSSLLEELSELEIRSLMRSRYLKHALDLQQLLKAADEYSDKWERIAYWVLCPHDPSEMPEAVAGVLEINKQIDESAHYVRSYGGFYSPLQETEKRHLWDLYPGHGELSPDHLLQHLRLIEEEHPGARACYEYLLSQKDPAGNISKTRLRSFWAKRAGFWVARIVDMPGLADMPDRDQLKETLRERGYLKDDGSPEALSDFIIDPWDESFDPWGDSDS